MAKSNKKKDVEEYAHLEYRLESYSCSVRAGINHELSDTRQLHDELPIYNFINEIELIGDCISPKSRLGEKHRISVISKVGEDGEFSERLKNYHVKNSDGTLKYRKRGDRHIPICDPPKCIGYLQKNQYDCDWAGAVIVPSEVVMHMFQLLALSCDL